MDNESPIAPPGPQGDRRRRLALGCLAGFMSLLCSGAALLFFLRTDNPPDGTATPIVVEATQAPSVTSTVVIEGTVAIGTRFPGRIAFTDGGMLGTIGAAGEDLRLIGDGEERAYQFPAWAPDGQRVAVLGSGDEGAGVYVLQDEVDGEATELYASENGAPIYIYWRPDGGAVSYIASGERAINLWLSPADGEEEPLLLAEGQPLYWDWVDEDSRLFVHTGTPVTGAELSFVEIAGIGESEFDSSDPGFFQAPGVSSNGAHIAFAELDDDERRLTVSNVENGERQSTQHQGVVAMGWSPTEPTLAYISPRDGARRAFQNFYGPLRLLDAETGEVTLLVDETVLAFFWSPDGEKIAYFTPGLGEQMASARSTIGTSIRGKVRRQSDDLRLSLSVVHVASGGSQHVVEFRPTNLFVRQFLPFFDQYALSHRLWSPDSTALVLPILEDDRARIYVAAIGGGDVRHLTDGDMAFWSPR
ncbi:MAG: hypothetical protein ACOC9E_00655 [Chloroflexota bacterium]